MKTLQQLQQDWGNSTCGREPEQYIYDYMQAYADQQVNKTLSVIIEQVEAYPMFAIEKEILLTYLESLKIKQP